MMSGRSIAPEVEQHIADGTFEPKVGDLLKSHSAQVRAWRNGYGLQSPDDRAVYKNNLKYNEDWIGHCDTLPNQTSYKVVFGINEHVKNDSGLYYELNGLQNWLDKNYSYSRLIPVPSNVERVLREAVPAFLRDLGLTDDSAQIAVHELATGVKYLTFSWKKGGSYSDAVHAGELFAEQFRPSNC